MNEAEILVSFYTGEDTLSLQRWFNQFSADGCSHRAKHLRLKDEPLCNSQRKLALQLLKMTTSVCFQGVSQVSSCQSKPADSS